MPPDPSRRSAGAARRQGEVPAPRESAPSRADLLARVLAADILQGRLHVGSELPGEGEIAAAHACGPGAVRTALRHLTALGLVVRSRGGQATVAAAEIRAGYEVRGQTDEAGGDYLARTRLLIARQRQVKGDVELAALLGTPAGGTWLRLSGVRMTADAVFGPLSCVDVWLATRAASLDLPEPMTPAALEALLGVTIVEIDETMAAGALAPAQARHLRARGGAPCLTLLRRYRRRGGTVVAAVRDIHPAERAGVLVRLRRV